MFSEKRGAQKNNIIEKMKNFIGAKVKLERREDLREK
jgi:hypothetical protein